MSKLAAVTAAQAVMATTRPDLIVDGKWGTYTQKVYDTSDEVIRLQVRAVLKAVDNITIESLKPKATIAITSSATSVVSEAIAAAAAEFGVPRVLLTAFADIESGFNPNAVNGSSKGLFQMTAAAWKDAGTIATLKPYAQSVFDPMENARAAAAFQKVLMKQLRTLGVTDAFTPAMLYLAHQQGAGGFSELWKLSKGLTVGTNYVTPKALKLNPPPDGKGPVLDKVDFYKRWMKVAEAKYSKYL